MAQGLAVDTSGLTSASQDMAGLQRYCQAIAEDAVAALSAMAGSAGHAGLASALKGASGKSNQAYTAIWAACGYASQSMLTAAQGYISADQKTATAVPGVPDQDIPFLNGIG